MGGAAWLSAQALGSTIVAVKHTPNRQPIIARLQDTTQI
jgi:hypothetical protein